VDTVWKREQLEARKRLENAQTPTRRVLAVLGAFELEHAFAKKKFQTHFAYDEINSTTFCLKV